MKSRFVSLLPLVLLSVACQDDESTASSPVDAGSDRDAASATVPYADAGEPTQLGVDAGISNANLTIGVDESADELTIVDGRHRRSRGRERKRWNERR